MALLGTANLATKKFEALFPAVMTAKGYQAEEVYAAFDMWDKATIEARRALVAQGKTPRREFVLYVARHTRREVHRKERW